MVVCALEGFTTMARLSTLSINGFRSIRELDSLSMSNLNILIGANGSGKSNFLELFKFVRACAKLPVPGLPDADIKKYVQDGGTAIDILHKSAEPSESIAIELHFGQNGYRLHLIPTQDDLLRIEQEQMYWQGTNKWYDLYSPDGYTPALLSEKENPGVMGPHGIAYDVYESIKSWQMYHFHDTGRMSPVKRTQNVFDTEYLRSDGSNIASYLLALKSNPSLFHTYREIVDTVQLVAPFFEDFILEPFPEGKIRLLWKQKGSDYPMKPQALSDGTLRFICLATVLLQPKHPDTIIIDEPELGLHPYAIDLLAELMKARSVDTQLLVATQSPELVSQFDPSDILVCDRNQGQTTCNRLDPQDLTVWLEDYSLGELWKKDLLSGVPEHE